MALFLSFKLRSTCGVGALQDPGIHGTTRDPPTKRVTEQNKTTKRHRRNDLANDIDFEETDIDTFISRRPDGLAFDKEEKYVCS